MLASGQRMKESFDVDRGVRKDKPSFADFLRPRETAFAKHSVSFVEVDIVSAVLTAKALIIAAEFLEQMAADQE